MRDCVPHLVVIAGWALYAVSLCLPAVGTLSPAGGGRGFLFGAECLQFTIVCFLYGAVSIAAGEITFERLWCLTYLPANLLIIYSWAFYIQKDRRARLLGGAVLALSFLAALTAPWCEDVSSAMVGYYLWCASFAVVALGLFSKKSSGGVHSTPRHFTRTASHSRYSQNPA